MPPYRQRRHQGLYYDPSVWDFGGAAVRGAMQGIQLGMGIHSTVKGIKEAKALEQANAEIAEKTTAFNEKVATNQERFAALDAPPEQQQKTQSSGGMSPALQQQLGIGQTMTPAPGQSPAQQESANVLQKQLGIGQTMSQQQQVAPLLDRHTSREALMKEKDTLRQEGLAMRGQLDRDIIDIYHKYGRRDLAEKHRLQSYDIAKTIATTVGPEAGLQYLQAGPDGDLFMGAQLVKDDGKYKYMELKDGSILRYNEKTGDATKFPGAGRPGIKDVKTIYNGKNRVSMAIMNDGSMAPLGKPSPLWKTGGSGDGGGSRGGQVPKNQRTALWQSTDARYKAFEKEWEDLLEDPNSSDVLKQVVRGFKGNLPEYRRLDQIAISQGYQPKNLNNVLNTLAKAGGKYTTRQEEVRQLGVPGAGSSGEIASQKKDKEEGEDRPSLPPGMKLVPVKNPYKRFADKNKRQEEFGRRHPYASKGENKVSKWIGDTFGLANENQVAHYLTRQYQAGRISKEEYDLQFKMLEEVTGKKWKRAASSKR